MLVAAIDTFGNIANNYNDALSWTGQARMHMVPARARLHTHTHMWQVLLSVDNITGVNVAVCRRGEEPECSDTAEELVASYDELADGCITQTSASGSQYWAPCDAPSFCFKVHIHSNPCPHMCVVHTTNKFECMLS